MLGVLGFPGFKVYGCYRTLGLFGFSGFGFMVFTLDGRTVLPKVNLQFLGLLGLSGFKVLRCAK